MQKDNPLVFPKEVDKSRKQQYAHYDKIYFGQHFEAYLIKADKEVRERYAKLRYIVGNFGGLMSRVLADMLFGEPITIDVQDKNTQLFIDSVLEENQLLAQLYESALGNSRRGDACFKLRVGPRNPNDEQSSIIIEEFSPANYFPVLQQDMARNTPRQDVIAIVFKRNDKTYLHKEIHEPGRIINEVWGYDEKNEKLTSMQSPEEFGYEPVVETGVKRSLVFHIPNVRDGSGFWGTSDYKDLDPLFFALNNRMTAVDNILDKHSDPILAVPPGVLDEDGKVKKQALQMFEVDNENPGFNKPEYIIWNANLESAFKQIDKLIDMLFMFSEIAPASLGKEQGGGGQAESGRALKFKLLATIRKRNRKVRYYDQALKDMLETAQELAIFHKVKMGDQIPKKAERPTVKWPDGVINDIVEETEMAIQRVDAGLESRVAAIARLDGITPDEAKKKVKEIDDESTANMPPALDPTTNPGGTGQPPQPPRSTKEQEPAPAGR